MSLQRLPTANSNFAKQRGFTLIELMVVLVIIGIATAAISLSMHNDPAQLLREDAKRLSLLLASAKSEAQASGYSIAWKADRKGYQFIRLASGGNPVQHFAQVSVLRPRTWQAAPLEVRVAPSKSLRIDPEWITEPQRITLSNTRGSVDIVLSASGKVEVK